MDAVADVSRGIVAALRRGMRDGVREVTMAAHAAAFTLLESFIQARAAAAPVM